jgi:thioredoxin-related protein
MRINNITKINSAVTLFNKAIKIIPVCSLLLTLQFSILAQTKGINFEKGSSWKNILEKARADNKYIFIDCYTTWCGPCRQMSENIFPMEEVGSFFNKNFINVKFQIDSTAKDAEEIKNQYADAAFVSTEYKISAYPTYLFINPNGELVHLELGSSNADEFITKATNALDPEKQYFTQVKKYEAGNRDAFFLKNLALIAIHAFDRPAASKYANEYLATNPYIQNKENMLFIYKTTSSTSDTGFSIMLKSMAKFEAVVDKNELHNSLVMIILESEAIKNSAVFGKWDTKKWDNYSKQLTSKYPAFAEEVLVQLQTSVFADKKDWKSYAGAVEKYAASSAISNAMLNEFTWSFFMNCNDKKLLEAALLWSEKTFEKETKKEPGYIDTYANILYKLGRKKEALTWEKKAQAIAIEQGADKNWGQDVIDKINNGEQTW